jgi:hypothetical protein
MTTPTPAPERQFLSQFGSPSLGLIVHVGGVLGDVDGNVVTVMMLPDAGGSAVFSRSAVHLGTGTYQTTLTGADSATAGYYYLVWSYQIAGIPHTYQTYIEIGQSGTDYDFLDDDLKAVIDQTWNRFADLFDSPSGGPVLQTYFESHYNRNRMAQLLRLALNRINTVTQPYQTFSLVDPGKFPTAKFSAILEMGLYIETLKHLIRSYVEQPIVDGGGQYARLERRDYMDRWITVLQMEETDYQKTLGVFKMQFMGLGDSRVLVSGGLYGNWGPTRNAYMAAQPRFFGVFY